MHAHSGTAFQRFLAPAAGLATATNLRGAIVVVENAYDETAEICGLAAAEIGASREMALLARASNGKPALPQIDVLVVREIGKNISGTGMDTNIIGRLLIHASPNIWRCRHRRDCRP